MKPLHYRPLAAPAILAGGMPPDLETRDGSGTGTTAQDVLEALRGDIKETYGKLDKKTGDMAEVMDELKKNSVDTVTLEGKLKEITDSVKGLAEQADALDKKMARPQFERQERTPGFDEQLGASLDEQKSRLSALRSEEGRHRIELKDITLAGNPSSVSPGESLISMPTTRPGIITPPEQVLRLRDLLMTVPLSTDSVKWIREASFTNNAAPVAEGALKPQSEITFEDMTTSAQVLAHIFRLSNQALDDMPMLRSYVTQRGLYGLALEEERQLSVGDGTGNNLMGFFPQATTFDGTGLPAGNQTLVDKVRWAKLQVRKSFYPATGVLLNPEDWALIELAKSSDGEYLHSVFTSGAVPRLWGMPVVESDAVPAGEFLVGAFAMAATLYDRMRPAVAFSTEDRDNFVTNRVTIRIEERLALAVEKPAAFVKG